mmetsp:Transcript_1809/g.4720  ORF Transcript_1809/g.4720 Transcript_1809/m.4720 type:complete len:118 (+) Transcript_1809:361-714(+)
MNDHEIDELLTSMGETDYTPEQYDFFYRNCNHFCDDLSQRLTGEMASVPRDFMENNILAESESLLSAMPEVQQTLTRGVTRQVQKVIVAAWRKQWKRALAEYEEQQEVEGKEVAPTP